MFENSTWQSGLTASFWTSIALGDIDGDGDLDLAQIGCTGTTGGTTCNGYVSKIYTNNGINLTVNSTWQQNLTAVHYGSIAWGDIDNDEDLDLALTGCNNGGGAVAACNNGEQSFIYLNNGTSLVENSTWKGDIMNVWKGSIAFGDIDLDGKLDLVLTGRSSTARVAKVYINNGTSFEENSTWQQDLTSVSDSAIALGDIDNDDKLDLILTGSDGTFAIAKVYINNGSSLVENTSWQQNLLAVIQSAISLGDYNNDGKLDLTLIGHTTHDNHEIYNNTGATFQMIQTEAAGTGDLVGIFEGTQGFGGYDNDGDLDLITSGEEQYTTLYLYNTTNSRFTNYLNDPEPGIFNTAFGPSAVWGDMDNDNDLDLVLIGVDSSDIVHKAKIYTNSITTPNTAPNPPDDFNASYKNNQLTLTWNNGSDTETPSLGLYYNLRVGTNSSGHQIVSGVYGGGDDNGYFGNMMQRKSITLNGLNLQSNQTIFWSVQTIDTTLKAGNWSTENNYTLPIDITNPTITVNTPIDGFNTSNPVITFNATVSDNINLTNVSLYGNWSGSLALNETNSSGINNTYYIFTKNLTSYGDGYYSWLIEARDATNNTLNSSIRAFRIDTTYPVINLISPTNASTWTSSSTVAFTYNVTDAAIANCSLIIGNAVNQTDTSITVNTAQTFAKSLSNGHYNWSINCTDYVNYKNNSETRLLTVNYIPPNGGGGAGGSGEGNTYPIILSQTKEVEIGLTANDKAKFTFKGLTHYITAIKVYSNEVTIRIESTPIEVILKPGQEVKFNLDNDNYQDLYIKLERVSGARAYFNVKEIHEEITLITPPAPKKEEKKEEIKEEKKAEKKPIIEVKEEKKSKAWVFLVGGLVMIIGLIGYFYVKRKNEMLTKKE